MLEDAGLATTIYENVSKPFVQIRQTGWMLSYMVMPAVASLAASREVRDLERITYDGSRMLIGLLTPVALLACVYAAPFLWLWVGPRYAAEAHLMRLFLVAVLPLTITVLVQASIGIGKIRVIAVASLVGSIVNLPLSYWLTVRIGVAGVIWGTVLTTLVSNLLVPGIYTFRVLEVRPMTFLARTLSAPLAGAAALLLTSWGLSLALSPDPPAAVSRLGRVWPLLVHLSVGSLAYLIGYIVVPSGRGDLAALTRRFRRRASATA